MSERMDIDLEALKSRLLTRQEELRKLVAAHHEETRPVQYEGAAKLDWAATDDASDLACPMYAPIEDCVAHALSGIAAFAWLVPGLPLAGRRASLAVFLGMAAMRRGLRARIYSYDLQIFDPTWTHLPREELIRKIRARSPYLTDSKRRGAAVAYVRYLEKGGELAFDELTPALLKSIIDRGHPALAGLSATYLYGFARERWDEVNGKLVDDDVAGEPTGHFIVVSGYDQWGRRLTVLDPSEHVPATPDGRLIVSAERLINSILLGDVTYDAVLLELWPAEDHEESA